MEVIDAQVHLNQIVPNWRTAPIDSVIETGIQAMDAVGLLAPYVRKFPNLQFIVDHCGVGVAPLPHGDLPVTLATSMTPSDYTVARDQHGEAWSHALYYLLDSDELSQSEKEWILAGSVRKALRWPRTEGAA